MEQARVTYRVAYKEIELAIPQAGISMNMH